MDMKALLASIKDKKAALKTKDKTIKASPGSNRYVVLQGWRKGQENVFYHDFGQHFIKNEAGEIQAVYQCLDSTYGRPCPVCDGLNKAMKLSPDDATVEVLKEAKASHSYLLNVLALDSDTPDVPQILEVRPTVFKGLLDAAEEWAAAMFDSEEPQIVIVNREGKGMTTKYTVNVSGKKHVMPKGVLTKLNDLDEYVRQESEENQRKAITAINSVAGLIAAPSKDRPATSDESISASMDPTPAKATPTAPKDFPLDEELDSLLDSITV